MLTDYFMDVSVGLVSQLVYDNELVFYIFSLFCVALIIILEGLRFLIFGALVRESNSRTIMIGVVSCVQSLLSVEKFWIVISLVSMLGRFLSVKFMETLPRFFHLPKTVSTFYFLFDVLFFILLSYTHGINILSTYSMGFINDFVVL